jgi:2-isopropylmalate synthase
MTDKRRIYIFDTTLRDGAQTQGVDFSVQEKRVIAAALDDLGVDYIEGGWPGANPTDNEFFATDPAFQKSRFTAFGMTKRNDCSASNDPTLSAVLNSAATHFCLVGKSWDFQVSVALGITLDENLDNIRQTITHATTYGETLFDAEHFFDGYKANPDYALKCLKAAYDSGARWIVLCDTNGGTLPHEIHDIVTQVSKIIPAQYLGIHAHDDTGNAVANSLAAVYAGCCMIQGTLNGLGERCGNANLISLIPTLMLKMGYDVGLSVNDLKKLRPLSHLLDQMLNRTPASHAPYIGERAFVHKGGLHASAVLKNPDCYEHIAPELVGNERRILITEQAGRSNLIGRLEDFGLTLDQENTQVRALLDLVKQRQAEGYAYDDAEASFEVLAREKTAHLPEYFKLERFTVEDERRYNIKGILKTESQAVVKLKAGKEIKLTVAEGNGPVNALDQALRKALEKIYPQLSDILLLDYRVRILKPQDATGAMPRVLIESGSRQNPDQRWTTIGVSTNIIDASYDALRDSYVYYLMKQGISPQ